MKARILKTTNGAVYSVASRKLSSLLNYSGNKLALIALHGGPGYPHDYLSNLSNLEKLLPIVLYDQIGCGKSDKIKNINLFQIKDFVEEVEDIRKFYKIHKLVLYAHSWGSILALEYYLKYSANVDSVIFVSPCISIPQWIEDSKFYLGQLSSEHQNEIAQANLNFRYNTAKYAEAVEEYYKLCVYRERPKPDVLQYCDQNSSGDVYGRFWGINEFTVTGLLKNYNGIENLKKLAVPSIFIAGEFDECLEGTLKKYSDSTPGSTYKVITGAKHLPNFENPEQLFSTVENFIKENR